MDQIDRIRAFNRFYTRAIGLLDRSYLDSGLTLTEVRVLYELANHPGQTARALAQGLGLDEGYLSRLLKRFAAQGWLERRPDPDDRRAFRLSLSPKGQAAYLPLAEKSREDIGALIASLAEVERERLIAALGRVEALLVGAPDPAEVILRDLAPGDAGWLIGQHGALYARDEGYDVSFEALVAEILAAFLRDHDPARERGWIAEAGGERLGSVFLVQAGGGLPPDTAKLRLFLLLPQARGLGLGQRLHDTCLGFARNAGYRRIVLWTHESHRAATRLYARNGWTMTGTEATHSFGCDVVEQSWTRDL